VDSKGLVNMENVNAKPTLSAKILSEIRDSWYLIISLVLFAIGAYIGVHAFGSSQTTSINHILLEYVGMLVFFIFSHIYETKHHFYKIEDYLERNKNAT
jgi:membrane protein YdbS with pleckstrin-like domain